MKNADAKLFRALQQFKSATRLLITGTPLQNNLKELWSLLHFLMPETFLDWEAFEVWFDFSDLQDEEGTTQFIENQESQDLVSKIHKVLQPLLLRRIKADVANYLPKKREYVLYAPMTKEQTDLYNAIGDKKVDTRTYLENKVVERLTGTTNTPNGSRRSSRQSSLGNSTISSEASSPIANNAFAMMMGKKGSSALKATTKTSSPLSQTKGASKRKSAPTTEAPTPKSSKSSRQSTPSSRGRGRPRNGRISYSVADDSEDDKLDDDAFEAKLAAELAAKEVGSEDELILDEDEMERVATLELASKSISPSLTGLLTRIRTSDRGQEAGQPYYANETCVQ